MRSIRTRFLMRGMIALSFGSAVMGQGARVEPATPESAPAAEDITPRERVARQQAIDRALAWLAATQNSRGAFSAPEMGQPGVTGLVVLAFLSSGHLPGEGPYGDTIDRAIDYMLTCQNSEGLIAALPTPSGFKLHTPAHTNIYNHAISSLALSEAYGMTRPERAARIGSAIERAIRFSRQRQLAPKADAGDKGGWRYLRKWYWRDADLSVTGWQLMFFRSARNAGFEVPAEWIDEAHQFLTRCYDPARNCFIYEQSPDGNYPTRGMVGAGILSLTLSGKHDSPIARAAGEWVLKNSFTAYNVPTVDPRTGQRAGSRDRYHYSAYYCSQAMFQLGGRYWQEFYPPLLKTLLEHQNPDGSWQAEVGEDNRYGNTYTTALVVLTLTPPFQLLPIFQR